MWTYLVVHPRDWRHRPTPDQIQECMRLLRSESIIGEKALGEEESWAPGPGLKERLGLSPGPSSSVTIHSSPQLEVYCGPMKVVCPQCESPVFDEDWSRLFSRFYESQVEPVYTCPSCRHETRITALRFSPGAAFAYFAMVFVEMGGEIRTGGDFWRRLEQTLGAHLSVTQYMV